MLWIFQRTRQSNRNRKAKRTILVQPTSRKKPFSSRIYAYLFTSYIIASVLVHVKTFRNLQFRMTKYPNWMSICCGSMSQECTCIKNRKDVPIIVSKIILQKAFTISSEDLGYFIGYPLASVTWATPKSEIFTHSFSPTRILRAAILHIYDTTYPHILHDVKMLRWCRLRMFLISRSKSSIEWMSGVAVLNYLITTCFMVDLLATEHNNVILQSDFAVLNV